MYATTPHKPVAVRRDRGASDGSDEFWVERVADRTGRQSSTTNERGMMPIEHVLAVSAVSDPDGNAITPIGRSAVNY